MSGRSKTGIGVASGEWLTADEAAQALAPKTGSTSIIRGRDKLPTLDQVDDDQDRLTLELIEPDDLGGRRVAAASEHPERYPTGRPVGGERTLQALDDQVTGESVRLIRCLTALQELSLKVSSRDLIPNRALIANRYFFFAFPTVDSDKDGLTMRTHLVDLENMADDFEEVTMDLYRLTSFKDAKNTVISREDRINLIKALTVIYTDYAGETMDDMAVDYRRVLESLNKFVFLPADNGRNTALVMTGEALKLFALKLRKICFDRGMAVKRNPSGTIPSDLKEECKATSSKIEDLMAKAKAERMIQDLTAIGNDLKRMLGTEKVDQKSTVGLIRDILDDGQIFVEDYMATYKLERVDASALLRRVFECRLPVSAMEIEQHYVFMILGEFLINSANLSEKDFKRFVAYLAEKAKK